MEEIKESNLLSTVSILAEKMKVCEHRIKELEEDSRFNTRSIQDVEIKINSLSNKLDNTASAVDKLLNKLEETEKEPLRTNQKIKDTAINSLITLFIGSFFAMVIWFITFYINNK